MEKQTANNQTVQVLKVELPKLNFKMLTSTGVSLFGLILVILGVLMLPTLVLTLPGIGAIIIGLVVMMMNLPKVPVKCPACGLDTKAEYNGKNFTCDKCQTLTPLQWIKE